MFKRPDDFDFDTNFVGVSCAECGREITRDDVIKQGKNVVHEQVNDMLRNALKGSRWKF
ncbi:ECs_2282 family putative zinc-binding protein [Escherichia sp. MOD1-EC6842]